MSIILILGGARSGKSRYAEGLLAGVTSPIYLATAEPRDDEMSDRIRDHRTRRGDRWRTFEEPLALAERLPGLAGPGAGVLVDCLTLWTSNLIGARRNVAVETARLITSLDRVQGTVIFVSNEVGLGIVPENALARRFRDDAGHLHQEIAARADAVFFMVAGLPLVLKDHRHARP